MREFGATMHGGNLSKWPAKMVDAFLLMQEEHSKVDNMMKVNVAAPQVQSPKPRSRR